MKDSFILKLLRADTKKGSYQVPMPQSNHRDFILLDNLRSNVKYTVNQVKPIPSISIELTIEAQAKDVPDTIDLTKESDIQKLKKTFETHFEQEIKNFLSFCQKKRVDPVGLGDLVRSRSRNWNFQQFQEVYPQLKTNAKVKVSIRQTGVGE